jgi:hypothetical protein
MQKLITAAGAALLLIAGNAMADTCPAASSITQSAQGMGFAYSAQGGWAGDNPMGNEGDIKTFKFTSAKVTPTSVICRYEADEKGGASLSIKAKKQVSGDNWNSDNECVNGDIAACTFG